MEVSKIGEFIRRYNRTRNVWENQRLKIILNHYHSLLRDPSNHNAYYLICKGMKVDYNSFDPLEILWDIHNENKTSFENHLDALVQNPIPKLEPKTSSFLDLKMSIAHKMLENCNFCEKECKVDRTQDRTGFCGVGKESFYSSGFLHMGEEAPLVPSGTIFFTGCNFACVFCQNDDISRAGKYFPLKQSGIKTSPIRLAEIAKTLVNKGAQNINWVGGDPIPNLHNIIGSMKYQEMNVCQLWNSNLYNSLDSLNLLSNVIDLWLPDFKYGNNECGKKYSKIDNYWDIIRRNFTYIYNHGSKNIIVRHLVMPNHIECCSKPILDWLAKNMRDHVVVNIMKQYHPENEVGAKTFPEINRRLRGSEFKDVCDLAESLGLEYKSVS